MKNPTFKIIFLLIVFFICFGSCTSKPIPIPGESAIILENIYAEYSNIGDTYFKLEDYQNAAKYYKLSMQNKNLYWESYYKLAKCYALLSDWNNAFSMYEEMLKRDKDNNSLKASLAYIYSMKGDVNEALSIYEELLTAESENEAYLENYLALLLSSSEMYLKNAEKIDELYTKIETNFEANKNLKIFESTIQKYKDENKKEDNAEKTETDELSDSENETTSKINNNDAQPTENKQ